MAVGNALLFCSEGQYCEVEVEKVRPTGWVEMSRLKIRQRNWGQQDEVNRLKLNGQGQKARIRSQDCRDQMAEARYQDWKFDREIKV